MDAKHPTSFVWDDGTRYYMLGQTYYNLMNVAMMPNSASSWQKGIDNSMVYGMTKVRLLVYPGYWYKVVTAAGVEIPDAQPYQNSGISKPNRDAINIDYFARLDEVVRYMDSRGMVADLIITQPYVSNRMFGTPAQNDQFVKYVVSRVFSLHQRDLGCGQRMGPFHGNSPGREDSRRSTATGYGLCQDGRPHRLGRSLFFVQRGQTAAGDHGNGPDWLRLSVREVSLVDARDPSTRARPAGQAGVALPGCVGQRGHRCQSRP